MPHPCLLWALLGSWFPLGAAAQPIGPVTAPAWVVADRASSTFGNVFYPSDTVELRFTLKSALVTHGGTWRIKEITDLWPYPWGRKDRLGTGATVAQGVIAPPAAPESVPVTVRWQPTRLGAFGVFLQLDDGSGAAEQMAWGFVVVYPPTPGRKPNSPLVFNLYANYVETFAPVYQRLGAKWVRWETGWNANQPKPGQWDWHTTDRQIDAARTHDIYIMDIMAHAPDWLWKTMLAGQKPLAYANGNKAETNPGPAELPQWQEWVRRFVERYHDVVRAGIVLNEPWEAGSISGWHGSGAHYRDLLRTAYIGAHAADPSFTVLANDSGMNVEDNILCQPGMMAYLDAVSIHSYRSYLAADVAQYGAYGKPVWDTESWEGVGEAENVIQCVMGLAQGFVKMQPSAVEDILINCDDQKAAYVSPTGQALSTLLHFIEDTAFLTQPRPNAAPWMMVFGGRPAGSGRNVAVIWGREQKWGNAPFAQVTRDGSLRLSDPNKELTAFDIYGNPLARQGGDVVIPLTTTPCYLQSMHGAEDLVSRLRQAQISGLQPVQITLHDFTCPLAQARAITVTLTNITNTPLEGTVTLRAPAGWQTQTTHTFAGLEPGASRELAFAITSARSVALNKYPVSVDVASSAGTAHWSETLNVTVFAKGTPPLNGSAADWQTLGAVPVFMTAKPTPVDSFTQYALPFKELAAQENAGYLAQVMGMWDETHFYILADIRDTTAVRRPSMKGVWYAMHDERNAWEYWMDPVFPACGGDMFNLAFNVIPYGEKAIANFPPEAQQRVPAQWRVDPADYEYLLYQAQPLTIPPGDYTKALAAYLQPNGRLRGPNLVPSGPPVPELWRSMAPGLARSNYFPFSPRAPHDQGLVSNARLVITRDGNFWHYRAAIPWTDLARVKASALAGTPVKFTFVCRNDGGTALDWNAQRSVSRPSQEILHPTWEVYWAPQTRWGFLP